MYKSLWPRPQSQWQNQKTETGAAAPARLPLPCTVAEPVCSLHLDPRPYPLALALLSFHSPLSTLPQSPHSTFSRPRPSPKLKFPLSCCFLSHSFPPPLLPLSSPEPRGLLARRGNQIAPFCPCRPGQLSPSGSSQGPQSKRLHPLLCRRCPRASARHGIAHGWPGCLLVRLGTRQPRNCASAWFWFEDLRLRSGPVCGLS
ncbi:hypothetical protein EDB80DRAFT_42590 [Ilyonectria destructans]|nr:hypothetical protein EDB80DRAFT_42590 [Ilyonectria destructans]